jgi:hypothetical protein
MAMSAELEALKTAGLVDAGVLAVGLERGWASAGDVASFAVEQLTAGADRAEVVELATAEELDTATIIDLLRQWAGEEKLASMSSTEAIRRWMFGHLKAIAESDAIPDAKLDRLEEAYPTLDYPEEMRECSRYYVPAADRARGITVGEVTASPLGAMEDLLLRLGREFRVL